MTTGHERPEQFLTSSDIEIRDLYTSADTAGLDEPRDLGRPGEYPFTRGVQPTMYRGRLWTMRQYAGFATAGETNRRFHYLLEQGQTGLSVAFDLPTQMGYDSDAPWARGEVGRVGVPISSLADMETLLEGIPLGEVSTSMTINATAPILLALYVAAADRQGVIAVRVEAATLGYPSHLPVPPSENVPADLQGGGPLRGFRRSWVPRDSREGGAVPLAYVRADRHAAGPKFCNNSARHTSCHGRLPTLPELKIRRHGSCRPFFFQNIAPGKAENPVHRIRVRASSGAKGGDVAGEANLEQGKKTSVRPSKLDLVAGLVQSQEVAPWVEVLKVKAASLIGHQDSDRGTGPDPERENRDLHSSDAPAQEILHHGAAR